MDKKMKKRTELNIVKTKLQKMRLERNLSRKQLAEKADISEKTLRNLEQGFRDIDAANVTTVICLCNALECRMEEILENKESKQMLKGMYAR